MGSAYRKLGISREDELSRRGISWCAACDGFFFREKTIAVVGGGAPPSRRPPSWPGSGRRCTCCTGETRRLDVSGLFIVIGHEPRSELFQGQVDIDENGYVRVSRPTTATSRAGVFAAGDPVDHHYRQAITAAGSGAAAALDSEEHPRRTGRRGARRRLTSQGRGGRRMGTVKITDDRRHWL